MHNYSQQGWYFKPAHLDGKNGTHWVLCLSMAVSQHCFLVISFRRIVRSSLDDGNAQWVKQQQLGRPHCCLHHLCCFCSADGSHPARHGGFVSLPACLAPALVGCVLCSGDFLQALPERDGAVGTAVATPTGPCWHVCVCTPLTNRVGGLAWKGGQSSLLHF